jgi:hypothetical protein
MNPNRLCAVVICVVVNVAAWGLGVEAGWGEERLAPPRFQAGFEYVIRSRQVVETVLGAGLPNAGRQVADVTFELEAACRGQPGGAGQRELAIRLGKVKMDLQMGSLRMTYDSALPDNAGTLLGQAFGEVVGKTFEVVLDGADQIVEVRGLEQAGKATPFGQQLGPEQLTQVAMPMLTLGIPREGVAAGESWEHVKEVAMGPAGKLNAVHRVSYAGDEAGLAVLRYEAELRLGAGAAGQPGTGAAGQGVLKGSMRVDRGKRFPVSGEGEGTLRMKVPNPTDPAQSIELPITQRRSFELVSMSPLE